MNSKLACRNFNVFMRTERSALLRAIEEDKWYLSERAGHDVGWDYAKKHFVENFLLGFSQHYRSTFCEQRCDYRLSCQLYQRYKAQQFEPYETVIA
ncbi:MAG: hypothetical protein OSB41_03480 [Kiritimatiellae bacterium]|nr:hypothetical protein [Kiritimatiellia bacterium]